MVELLARHALLAALPALAGGALAVALTVLLRRLPGRPAAGRRTVSIVSGVIAVLGGLPVVAVWVALPIITGQPLLRTAHLEIALALLGLAVCFRRLADAPTDRDGARAGRALGVSWWQRAVRATRAWLPALGRGLAAAWVATVLGVTLAALLGDGAANGLGRLIVAGWRADDRLDVLFGTALVAVLAAAGDGLLRLVGRLGGARPMGVR